MKLLDNVIFQFSFLAYGQWLVWNSTHNFDAIIIYHKTRSKMCKRAMRQVSFKKSFVKILNEICVCLSNRLKIGKLENIQKKIALRGLNSYNLIKHNICKNSSSMLWLCQ